MYVFAQNMCNYAYIFQFVCLVIIVYFGNNFDMNHVILYSITLPISIFNKTKIYFIVHFFILFFSFFVFLVYVRVCLLFTFLFAQFRNHTFKQKPKNIKLLPIFIACIFCMYSNNPPSNPSKQAHFHALKT